MEGIRSILPLVGESFAYIVLLLLGWRELRELKRLRLEREAREQSACGPQDPSSR